MTQELQRSKCANALWVLTGLVVVSSILLYSGCGMTSSPNTPRNQPIPDTIAPTSAITSPTAGATISTGTTISITGAASDTGGGTVARVDVSVDGGATYSAATGTTSWSFSWTPTTPGQVTIKSRAIDNSGNAQDPPAAVTVAVVDTTPPTSIIISPAIGDPVATGTIVNITGTASDAGGGSVQSVQVSVDGGATYSAAMGTTAWSFNWTPTTLGPATIKSRAIDNSGNQQNPPAEITVTVRLPIRVPSDQPTIQAAINVATDGDTVLVAPGTYPENINFGGKAIAVISESGPEITIINGENVAAPVVRFISGEGRDSALNGFTVQNGSVHITSPGSGGGIQIQNSSPKIINNLIRNNQACQGGGIGIDAGSPLIHQNTITSNINPCVIQAGGGGIFILGAGSAEILDNVISDNVTGAGGGIYMAGGRATPIIKRNVIKGNDATSGRRLGGGVFLVNDVEALIVQNLITGNQAGGGGGIYSSATKSVIANNTIADNDSSTNGSGIYADGYQGIQLTNNIIAAKHGQSALHCNAIGVPSARFNNIFSAGGPAYSGACSNMTGTDGNISADPLFTNPAQGDYHLQQLSPSIDAGDNQAPNIPDTDVDGDLRILDGDGNGTATIDMGVDEFLLPPGSTTPISIITSPGQGATISTGTMVSITGLAKDAGGGIVAQVEVSVDGGATWDLANGMTAWSYNWTPTTPGSATIKSRAVDDSRNVQDIPAEITVTVRDPVTIRVPSANQPTIQSAINAAGYGDTVLVAPGTYNENINFGGKAITVASESGRPEDTIIDGGNAHPVVIFNSGEGRDSALNGFTLQNGRGGFDNQAAGEGGGVKIVGSSPRITNNLIRNNQACHGAGIWISSGSPLIQLNTITNNDSNLCSGGTGSGISIRGTSSVEILDNVISNNGIGTFQLAGSGGGIYMFGLGTLIVKRNIIKGNSLVTDGRGGGIYLANESETLIVQNLITGNQAYEGAGIYLIAFGAYGPKLVNNTIADNNAIASGSGIFAEASGGRSELANNIIVAKPGQAGLYCNNTSDQTQPGARFNNIFSAGGTAYGGSCADKTGTNGNISADPLFINPTGGDYHLRQGSPSIDAGDNLTPNLPDKDVDENPRILDGDGNGTATIDMGVDEFLLPLGLKISLLDESNPGSKNIRSLSICDLRPWARTPGRRPKNTLSALPPRSPRLGVK